MNNGEVWRFTINQGEAPLPPYTRALLVGAFSMIVKTSRCSFPALMITLFVGCLTLTAIITCTVSAQRLSRKFAIKKYRRHLLDMKSHCLLTCLFIMRVTQPLDTYLQLLWNQWMYLNQLYLDKTSSPNSSKYSNVRHPVLNDCWENI